jgi:hypothetical protein
MVSLKTMSPLEFEMYDVDACPGKKIVSSKCMQKMKFKRLKSHQLCKHQYLNLLGCAVPPQTTAPKGQNDAFHASWHTTNLNTLGSP